MSTKERNQQLVEISGKLDILIRLNALGLVRDAKTRREQVAILSDANIGPKSIAGILGTTENTVSVTLHSLRKERALRQSKEETPQLSESSEGRAETLSVQRDRGSE